MNSSFGMNCRAFLAVDDGPNGEKPLRVDFALDWRNKFTIVIERKALARFETAGLDFGRLAGAWVRVRAGRNGGTGR